MNVNIVKEYPTPFGSDNVISMRGYSKPSSTSAIETTDTLNTAIGKLEKAIESGGSGNTVSKTRYQISSASWSSSANSDGFYTLTATLNPAIGSSPDVYAAGSADGTQPTDTQKTQFSYLKRCKVNGSTLTLYASSKPSSTFYIWVEGVNGTGSGDIVGNVIQPNGGGITYSTTETLTGDKWIDGKPIYRKVINFGYLPDTDTKTVSLGITSYDRIISVIGFAETSIGYGFHLPRVVGATALQHSIGYYIDGESKSIVLKTEVDQSLYYAYFIIEYTK